ncbi:hypothetical protein [Lactiplantibacillus carotarum]|uniref:hypothetical protein n=1 Tax=Lactiplantibacillus carotarum TaxID=2993456 RepID=UPI00298F1DDD|nr:hypothetical protein [Lactiplantibacillus carotarum]
MLGLEYQLVKLGSTLCKTLKVYDNFVLQLFLNQLTNDNLAPVSNLTGQLLITQPEWSKTLFNGRKQRHALKIECNWERDLVLSVATFKEVSEGDSNTEKYLWDQARGIMRRDFKREAAVNFIRETVQKYVIKLNLLLRMTWNILNRVKWALPIKSLIH